MEFVDLEKAFDRVPREVLWWALRSLGLCEWMIHVVELMYDGVRTAVKVNGEASSDFGGESGRTSRICTEPVAIHCCYRGSVP